MKCGGFSVHTMKNCYATALYITHSQAASGGEETAWAPLLTHVHHTHVFVHAKVSKRYEYPYLYGCGAQGMRLGETLTTEVQALFVTHARVSLPHA